MPKDLPVTRSCHIAICQFMMWDCSSAPRMLTTLQHQRTYCVYSMNHVVIGYMCVLVCIVSSAHAQSCMLPTCFVNGSLEIQCTSCPFGFGVQVINREFMRCSDSPPRNTKCEPCKAGVNFSNTNDLESKCLGCRICHSKKEVMTKECTAESDRECICKEGHYYYDYGPDSCVPCTTCREDQEETIPCTPTENRVCGPRRIPPVTTTPVPPTTNQTMSTVSTDPPDTGMSTKAEPDDKPLSTGEIAGIVIGAIAIIAIIGTCLMINCCIANQTNNNTNQRTDNLSSITTVSTNAMNGRNGTTQYHLVPILPEDQPNGVNGRQPNGVIGRQPNGVGGREHRATSSTTEETDLQQSVEDALFSAETRERVIRRLDAHDRLGRNALMLADQHLSPGTCNLLASNNAPASDVLNMWVKQGKTKEQLTQALRDMGRDDVADICEEDSAGS